MGATSLVGRGATIVRAAIESRDIVMMNNENIAVFALINFYYLTGQRPYLVPELARDFTSLLPVSTVVEVSL